MWIGIWSFVAGILIGGVLGRLLERTKWQRHELARRDEGDSASVQQSIDAMSADLERLREGQAFLTKVLSAKANASTGEPR
jgi:hypothetical protein